MRIREAIILAGGLGTRLRSSVPDLPKCMAPVAGRPFISYVIDYLRMQGIERFIFSLGYRSEDIIRYLNEAYPTLDYVFTIEEEPLGTGGAIQLSLEEATEENVVVANGDTMFHIDLEQVTEMHERSSAECTLALKLMQDFHRYGVVQLEENGKVHSFHEKKLYKEGLINGGIYLVNTYAFSQRTLPKKFSFEKDYLEAFTPEGKFYGCRQEGYFIDIGIPEDFTQAQLDFRQNDFKLDQVDHSWTLFLDRDGVINNERVGNYVMHWEQFIFSEGVLEAFKTFSDKFKRIFIVTNQRGIGKGLMSVADLDGIHKEMQKEVETVGGRIDRIYYCTELNDNCFYRKPNPGMAVQAKKEFPDINFSKALMVGNKPSDMRFGRSAGMCTVFVKTTNKDQPFPHPDIDMMFETLQDFARAL